MNETISYLAIFAVGLLVGLYMGERGRRLTVERLLVSGTPEKPNPQRLGQKVPSEEMVQDVGKIFTEETLERGVDRLIAEAKEEGITLTPEEAREQAQWMLGQLIPFSQDEEADIGLPHA